jgi:excinuclease ABC subunit A
LKEIIVKKANVHNLDNVDITIARGSLTVVTGPSGSGKSSLAFDTIFAEGQRRYIESLSSYARQFLGQMDPPDVESIVGLSPAIAIDQKSTTKNPRSTVGTVTEVYDYLRVMYARLGTPYCPDTGEELSAQSAQMIVDRILEYEDKTKIQLLSPVIRNRKGEHKDEISKYLGMGFSRLRIDGTIESVEEEVKLNKNTYHDIEVVVDRMAIKAGIRSRLADSVELALKLSGGFLIVLFDEEEQFFSEKLVSAQTGRSFPDLNPRIFSFNSPLGACEGCNGLGIKKVFDKDKYIFDEKLSINEGAIAPLSKKSGFLFQMIKCIAKKEKADLDKPLSKMSKKFMNVLFEGSDTVYEYTFVSENSTYNFKKPFIGIENWLERKYKESSSDRVRSDLEALMNIETCPSCEGQKLNDFSRNVKVGDLNISSVCALPIDECLDFFKSIKFSGNKKIVADKLLKEIKDRLNFLLNVGLNYLTLNREAMTLSGGESQRIRLATQIGSALSGVLYVLDEPSIGLHQRDNERLIKTLKHLRELGNTVIVVEHDEDTMMAADFLVDMGPGAGIHGGHIVSQGTPEHVCNDEKSITGRYLSGKEQIEIPKERRKLTESIYLKEATENNLNKLDVEIPIGGMICVSGVSGSGKSTLVHKVLTPAVKNSIRRNTPSKTNYKAIKGADYFKSIIELDQSPIGRTPKSNPATYTGLFDEIRKLFASTNESKVRGFKQGRFSFNVKGGRCETCEGNGLIKVEMNFLPDVYITCSSCEGRRYNRETLNILYRGKSIADILFMSIEEAQPFFENHKKINRILETLNSVGLGYMKLGQPSTTLSGGEAQRLKLSRELSKQTKGKCLYVLDEPTTGLHFRDIKVLLAAINRLVDHGHTVIIIEHNLDVIKTADHIIDLGPDGGKYGGTIVAQGTPEAVAKVKGSHTAMFLSKLLKKGKLKKDSKSK